MNLRRGKDSGSWRRENDINTVLHVKCLFVYLLVGGLVGFETEFSLL